MSRKLLSHLAVVVLLSLSASALLSASPSEARLSEVEQSDAAGCSALFMLFGAFCALWAQNTRRNALLWFILGVLFNVITVLVLLYKNSQDPPRSRLPMQGPASCPKCGRPRAAGEIMCDCGHYFGAA